MRWGDDGGHGVQRCWEPCASIYATMAAIAATIVSTAGFGIDADSTNFAVRQKTLAEWDAGG